MASERKPPGFVGHAANYAIGNIARRFVGFLMLPIYTRFLTPADYGVIGLLTLALALFESVFGARMGRAIPKFYFDATESRDRRTVIWGSITLTCIVSAASMVALMLLRGVGSQLIFGDRKYALALGLFAVNLLSRPVENTGMLYIRLQERSRLFLTVSMSKLVLQVILNLLLVVYWREGVIGAVLSGIISSALVGVWLIVYVAAHEAPALDMGMTRKMLKFTWPLWLSGLAGLYIGSSGGMYLRVFGSLSAVGLLELGLRFAAVVSMLVWTPFFQHWEPLSYRYYKEADGKRKFQVAFIVISTLMFASGLGISIFSQPVIRFMAAKSFYGAAAVVPILTFGIILSSLTSLFNFSFIATGHTKVHSVCQYFTAIVITILYVTLVPAFGLVGAAAAQCLASVVAAGCIRQVSRRYYDPGFNLAPLGAFTLIGVVAYSCSNIFLQVHNIELDLAVRLLVLLGAAALMVLIGARAVRAVDGSMFENLPWPLDRLGGVRIERQSQL